MTVVAISGASGFVGSALADRLRRAGHVVMRLSRVGDRGPDTIAWDPATGAVDAARAATVEAVVHLAGASIASGRWTAARRRAIADSRGPATERLCRTLAALPRPPVLLSASAVGIYGNRGDELLDERSERGHGFLADVASAWERAAAPLRARGSRVVHLRIGIVLGRGGALAKMLPAFRLGLGGRLGSGRQFTSWIAMGDLLAIVEFLLARADIDGPVVCAAPTPVTNRDFTRALGRVLHRPTVLPVPAFALRLLLAGLADEALLASQRAVPRRLLESGFAFALGDLDAALRAALEG